MKYIDQYFEDQTDEQLIAMTEYWDPDFTPDALVVLSSRKHPQFSEICKRIADWCVEQNWLNQTSSLGFVISIWYNNNEESAIAFIKEHYKLFHNEILKHVLSCLWVDSEEENKPAYKKELILLMKNHLSSATNADIKELGEDYTEFMKAYGNW